MIIIISPAPRCQSSSLRETNGQSISLIHLACSNLSIIQLHLLCSYLHPSFLGHIAQSVPFVASSSFRPPAPPAGGFTHLLRFKDFTTKEACCLLELLESCCPSISHPFKGNLGSLCIRQFGCNSPSSSTCAVVALSNNQYRQDDCRAILLLLSSTPTPHPHTGNGHACILRQYIHQS